MARLRRRALQRQEPGARKRNGEINSPLQDTGEDGHGSAVSLRLVGSQWTICRKRRRCIRGCIGDGAEGKTFNTPTESGQAPGSEFGTPFEAQGKQRTPRRNREESMRRRTIELAVVLVAAMGVEAWGGTRVPPLETKGGAPAQLEMAVPQTTEGDFVAKDFRFRDGETLAELRLHYATLGKPQRDAAGRVTNAVMLLHGTGGSGAQFLQPQFAGELFGAGQLLDTAKYYIIFQDGIGHGKSSKPSDGLHAKFPQYDYDDMVAAHHAVLEHLGVAHLRLILGTSMGCMHSFVWGETYPEFMDALMPLACQPVQIAGRNRVWRKMVMDAIRNDPEWKGGEYAAEPRQGLRTALDLLLIAGSAPLLMQKTLPTGDAADKYLDDYFAARLAGLGAIDVLY